MKFGGTSVADLNIMRNAVLKIVEEVKNKKKVIVVVSAMGSTTDNLVKKVSYETSSVYGFGHPAYYENMLKALSGEVKPVCSGEDGLKSLELLVASYLSAEKGSEIQLPLKRI